MFSNLCAGPFVHKHVAPENPRYYFALNIVFPVRDDTFTAASKLPNSALNINQPGAARSLLRRRVMLLGLGINRWWKTVVAVRHCAMSNVMAAS